MQCMHAPTSTCQLQFQNVYQEPHKKPILVGSNEEVIHFINPLTHVSKTFYLVYKCIAKVWTDKTWLPSGHSMIQRMKGAQNILP